MLVSQLKRVAEIDSRIVAMHRELAELYEQRLILMGEQAGLSTLDTKGKNTLKISTKQTDVALIDATYRHLAAAWEHYGITLPTLTKIRAKLQKAARIKTALQQNYPDIAAQLEIVGVPPVSDLKLPITEELRRLHGASTLSDYVNPAVSFPKTQKQWRFLLAYTAPESVPIGSAQKAKQVKAYMLAGFDMRDLGVREYAAMSLQVNTTLDENSSTILFKNHRGTAIPYAGFRYNRYRFELEDSDNVLEDDGFRPAIEL